jgi:gluconate 2-dehydrogenase gamma chain
LYREISADQQDALLSGLQKGTTRLEGTDGRRLFDLFLTDVKQGFFTDQYGGNTDMAGWRTIGFPGARYDYSDWVLRHNERYPLQDHNGALIAPSAALQAAQTPVSSTAR